MIVMSQPATRLDVQDSLLYAAAEVIIERLGSLRQDHVRTQRKAQALKRVVERKERTNA